MSAETNTLETLAAKTPVPVYVYTIQNCVDDLEDPEGNIHFGSLERAKFVCQQHATAMQDFGTLQWKDNEKGGSFAASNDDQDEYHIYRHLVSF